MMENNSPTLFTPLEIALETKEGLFDYVMKFLPYLLYNNQGNTQIYEENYSAFVDSLKIIRISNNELFCLIMFHIKMLDRVLYTYLTRSVIENVQNYLTPGQILREKLGVDELEKPCYVQIMPEWDYEKLEIANEIIPFVRIKTDAK